MKDEHVINLLESEPLASLSETDLAAIRAHAERCSGCLLAFQSAQVAALLLKERVGETFEPSPFFHTRVLATLRERQAAVPAWTLSRLWRSAGALASSMVATVAALAVLTFVIPGTELTSVSQQASSLAQSYSAEEVILNETAQLEEQLSDDQLLNTIYGGE
jgi:anti-sigma-K factor RskA